MTPERLAEIRARADMPRLGLSLAREMDKDVLAIRDLVAEVTSLWAQRDGTGDVASGTLWRAEREVSRLNNELGAQLALRTRGSPAGREGAGAASRGARNLLLAVGASI